MSGTVIHRYDSVLLFAHAATYVLAAGGDIRDGREMVRVMTSEISFKGISQRNVALDVNGDLIAEYSLMNYHEQDDGEMRGTVVGTYAQRLELRIEDVRWPGRSTQVPWRPLQSLAGLPWASNFDKDLR